MLATQITNHVQAALRRLLSQYQDRRYIAGFYTGLVEQIQDLENAIFALNAGRQIWDGNTTPAIGAQLDGIGQIVGVARNGLPDDEYILLIFGKIAENFSDDTVTAVLAVIAYVFQAEQILIQEIYPAGLYISVLNPQIPQNLFSLAQNLVENAIGAGIKLVLTSAETTAVFRFAGPGVSDVNGFGDVNVPDSGGVFVGQI